MTIAARPTLAARGRDVTGKAVAGLRRAGQLPGVVYGRGLESANVTVDAHEFAMLRRRIGANALVDVSVDGGKAQPVLVREVQVHPVNRRPLHVDLFVVRMTEELTVEVPLVATGQSLAVTEQSGTLIHAIENVRVRALPDHLPRSIEYSIESLVDFEATIHVSDLTVPSDVTLLNDADELVARVLPPRVEEVEEVAPVVPAEGEAAEGEAAEGAEGRAEGAEGAGEGAEGRGEGREGRGEGREGRGEGREGRGEGKGRDEEKDSRKGKG
jgi:large subunit ribosomal protein L25